MLHYVSAHDPLTEVPSPGIHGKITSGIAFFLSATSRGSSSNARAVSVTLPSKIEKLPMYLPPTPPSDIPDDWDNYDDDIEYTTVPPPASIYRSCVDEILDQPHQEIFRRAVTNILHTKAAEITLAQLIDGLPLRKFAKLTHGISFHSCVHEHETLSPGAMDKFRELRDGFDVCAELDLPVEVLKRYQNIPAGSRASKLPLIELVAVAIHRIAGLLYEQGKQYKGRIEPPVEEGRLCYGGPSESNGMYYPTPFCLWDYANPD